MLRYNLGQLAPIFAPNTCLVIGFFQDQPLTQISPLLDAAGTTFVETFLKQEDFRGEADQTALLYPPHVSNQRWLLMGLGKKESFTAKKFAKAHFQAARALQKLHIPHAINYLTLLEVPERDMSWKLTQAVQNIEYALYRFDEFKTGDRKKPDAFLTEITCITGQLPPTNDEQKALNQGQKIAEGVKFIRDLGNLPSNICTPTYLANQAKKVAEQSNIKLTVLEKADVEKLGMNALLAVAKGSHEPLKFITLEYQGAPDKKSAPFVFIGKGVTFDSGGISIKPSAGMDEMKYDMCGAATVLGLMKTAAALQLPLNITGIMVTTENMPGGSATKPGDIVVSLSGQSIEILNTDAEGRLILADALTYAERFSPRCVIDLATLTGAIIVALGLEASGLMGNDPALLQALQKAGDAVNDRAWTLPLWPEHDALIDSPFADMANISPDRSGAKSITAGCFLQRFAKKFKWAHLDIAGSAWTVSPEKTATGRPLPLLIAYLLESEA